MSTELNKLSFKPSISSHGYGAAKIVFLAGYPLQADLQSGLALSGHNETTINSLLKPYRLSLSSCYRMCVIREKLEYSGTKIHKLKRALDKVDVEAYEQMLLNELKEINPNVIVPLDDIALAAVFPHIRSMVKSKKRWIYCYRGSVLPLRSDWQHHFSETHVKVIPTLGPQLIYNDWQAKAYITVDYERIAKNESRRGQIEEMGVCHVIRTAKQLQAYFEKSFTPGNNDGFLTFDIETWGGFITCISFCMNGYESISVPLFGSDIPLGEMAFLWKIIAKALAHDIPKCGQNIKFDWLNNERHGLSVENVVHDTMLKASLIYPELTKGLDFLTSFYTEMPYYKDEGKEYNPKLHTRDRLYLYNAKDSLATHQINKLQEDDMEKQGVKDLYYNEIVPSLIIYKNMDKCGVQVDATAKQFLLDKYQIMKETNISILRSMVGDSKFNPNSPQQVGAMVYDELGYPKKFKIDEDGKKSYKTDKDTLDDLLISTSESTKSSKYGRNIIARIITCRKISRVSDYLSTELYPDGRWKASSNLAGTKTGRSSSGKTIDQRILDDDEIKKKKNFVVQLGRSLQTITKHGFQLDEEVYEGLGDNIIADDLRSMFVPSRDFLFIEGDGSQAEARVVAVLAEDYELLASFDQKPKIHAKTAALLFGIDVNTITSKEPKIPGVGMAYYDMGKRARHAGNYDMREFRLAQMTHAPLKECKRILNVFHDANPNIRGVYHKDVADFLREYHYLVTPFGRRRDFFGRIDDSFFKEGYAQIPQSAISDLTKFTMWRVKDELMTRGIKYMEEFRFLTEQHDGILSEVHKDYKEMYLEVFRKHYEREIDFMQGSIRRDFRLTIPCELTTSDTNWMELH